MKNRYAFIIFLALFLLEGSLIVPWILPSGWLSKMYLAPHFTLVALLVFAMQRSRYVGLLYGFAIGLLQDVVYGGPMVGPHAFLMAFAVYGAGYAARRIKLSMASTLFIISLSLLFYDFAIYAIYDLFRIASLSLAELAARMLAPSLLFNLLFAVLIYVPARKLFERKAETRDEEGQHV